MRTLRYDVRIVESVPEIHKNGKTKKMKAIQVLLLLACIYSKESKQLFLCNFMHVSLFLIIYSDEPSKRCADQLVYNCCFGEDEGEWCYLPDPLFSPSG